LRDKYTPHFDAHVRGTKAVLANVKGMLQTFEKQNGRLPTTAEGLRALVANPGLPGWTPLVDKVPKDGWGHELIYKAPGGNGEPYELYSVGKDGEAGTADDVWPDDDSAIR
jgi:general secretion pathway protein G